MRFLLDGIRINARDPTTTPESLEMKDGDSIDVMPYADAGNWWFLGKTRTEADSNKNLDDKLQMINKT